MDREKNKELLNKILDEDIWKQNTKENIKLYVKTEVRKALDEAYAQGFETAEKVVKKEDIAEGIEAANLGD